MPTLGISGRLGGHLLEGTLLQTLQKYRNKNRIDLFKAFGGVIAQSQKYKMNQSIYLSLEQESSDELNFNNVYPRLVFFLFFREIKTYKNSKVTITSVVRHAQICPSYQHGTVIMAMLLQCFSNNKKKCP